MSMMLRMAGTLGQRRVPFFGLLDLYPGAAAAYSLRTLSASFVNQPIIRVRRSSDNTEADFTAAEITNGTLTTWTGANDGFVRTWYDQSGNARHAEQTTAGNQPQIVDAGALVTDGLKFDGESSHLRTQDAQIVSNTHGITSVVLGKVMGRAYFAGQYNSSESERIWGHNVFGATNNWSGFSVQGNPASFNANQAARFDTSPTLDGILSGFWTPGNASKYRYNGGSTVSAVSVTDGASQTSRPLEIGSINDGSIVLDGNIKEVIIWPMDQSADDRLSAIESNINAAWEVF